MKQSKNHPKTKEKLLTKRHVHSITLQDWTAHLWEDHRIYTQALTTIEYRQQALQAPLQTTISLPNPWTHQLLPHINHKPPLVVTKARQSPRLTDSKYGMNCRFYHSQVICKEYAEEGGCQTTGCSKRHPRQCRYWTENPEGCRRSDTCQYLHAKLDSLSNNESDNTDIMGEVGEDKERVSPCDKRDSYHDNRNASRCHRRSTDPETEESYLVLKGSDGKARFVCKKCEATFTSQKSIKQHDTMKHVDPMWPY